MTPERRLSALALLMLGVLADDHHAAFAADDLALFADGLHGRLDLHDVEPPFDWSRRLFRAPGDAALRQIVGRHFDCDLIAGQDADEVGPQLAGDVRQQGVAAGRELPSSFVLAQHFHLKDGVRQSLAHDAFDLDNVFFRQAICLLMDLLSLSGTDGGSERHILSSAQIQ